MDYKINKGIFSFLYRQGLPIGEIRRILTCYAKTIDESKPKKGKLAWYIKISDLAQADFKNFKKVYNANKSGAQRTQSYDEWWSERNLDGSFAYSGVTDDF